MFAHNDQPDGPGAGPQTIGIGCDVTGGASGGGWIVDLSAFAGETNLLNGSHGYSYSGPNPPENLKEYGPYFGTPAIRLRNAAQSVPVP